MNEIQWNKICLMQMAQNDFCLKSLQEIAIKFYAAGLEAEADHDANDTFNKRIRNAQVEQWNFILVVGDKEKENGTVAVRTRDTQEKLTLFSRENSG